MNANRILKLIDNVTNELDKFVQKNDCYTYSSNTINDTVKILKLLKIELTDNPQNINIRVLRSVHNIGMYAYRAFENSELEQAIYGLTKVVREEIPHYSDLEPLIEDFGEGDPI